MIPFAGFKPLTRVLCLGAHCDDIEIGAGGTILRLLSENPTIQIKWVVFSGLGSVREAEARSCAKAIAGVDATVYGFADTLFRTQHVEIKNAFNDLKSFNPDLVFTHSADDRHQDHRLINEFTWNAFRNHQILEYEIPKWDGDLQRPNVYVPIAADVLDRKIELLMKHFQSQAAKHWFDAETFRALPRLRGLESNARFAEAFVARKLVI